MAASVRSLFPPCVAVVEATAALWEEPLAPEEEHCVRRAVAKRVREFRAGRACARHAIRALGLEPPAIPVGPDRAPVWPAGVVGSITHSADFAAAVVARRDDVAGVGIDAERRDAVRPELLARICTPAELRWLEEVPGDGELDADASRALVFSAKECLYKALHPALAGAALGFHDARLLHPPREGRFAIEITREDRVPGVPTRLDGRFCTTGRHVVTGLTLPAPS